METLVNGSVLRPVVKKQVGFQVGVFLYVTAWLCVCIMAGRSMAVDDSMGNVSSPALHLCCHLLCFCVVM